MAAFARRIKQHDGDALVSNELLSMRGPRRIKQLVKRLGPAQLDVIITARDLGRTIPSQWQERARNRPTGSWAAFMAALCADGSVDDPELAWFWQRQDIGWIASNWAAELGVDRVTVVTVPPRGAPFPLVAERFFSVLGIDELPDLVQPTGQNPALGAPSVEFVRRLHDRLSDDERERLRIVLKHVLSRRVLAARRTREPVLELTPDQMAWARGQAERTIDDLARLGVRVVGDPTDLMPTASGAAGAADPGGASDAELLAVALDAVVGLAEALDELARASEGERPGDVLRRLAASDGSEARGASPLA